ncbi:MAG: sugar transferase [Bryobacteraceae bacterium]
MTPAVSGVLFLGRVVHRRWYRVCSVLADVTGLGLAWFLSFGIRLLLNPVMRRSFTPGALIQFAIPLWHVLVLWAIAAITLSLYKDWKDSLGGMLANTVRRAMLFCGILAAYGFFVDFHDAAFSRGFITILALAGPVGMLTAQYVLVVVIAWLGEEYVPPERVIVAGNGYCLEEVLENLSLESGYRVVGIVTPADQASPRSGVSVRGTIRHLAEIINRDRVDRLVIANSSLTRGDLDHCVDVSSRMGIPTTHALATVYGGGPVQLAYQFGMPVAVSRPKSNAGMHLIKRVFDIVAATILLVLCAPVLLFCAAAIKLTSNGPVLYRSLRVGKGGRYFTFYKFRSMYVDQCGARGMAGENEQSGHLFKVRHDPRVTTVGKWMRRFSLDELPQIFNVLLGNMSLVGPRPLPASDLDPDGQSSRFANWAAVRSSVTPGITGLWQVKGRSDLSFSEMIALDTEYVRNWSLGVDLRILLVTPVVVFTGRGAY